MVAGSSGAVTIVAFGVMCIFTVWFGNFMLRTIDIIYKPSVKQWIRSKSTEELIEQRKEVCPHKQTSWVGPFKIRLNRFFTIYSRPRTLMRTLK